MDTLKKFAAFLKEGHLTELAKANLEIIRPMNVPLMKFFEHLPEDQLLALTVKGLEEFLTDLENGNAINKSRQNLVKWENGTLEGMENLTIEVSDLVLISAAQNKALMRFIPKFTDKPEVILTLTAQLADYYTETQNAGYEVLFRIRKKAEQALIESEERFRSVSQSASDGIIIFDPHLQIEFWNKGAENIFGFTSEEMVGNSLSMIHPPDKRMEYKAAMERFRENKQNEYIGRTFELECMCKDGKLIPTEMSLSVFETSKGSFFSIIVHDISERKKSADLLSRSNEELENFAYVASHDMKEPLRMVSNYVQLLAKHYRGRLDEDADQYIDYALNGTTRIRRLIDDLLDYSRVGHAEHEDIEVDLNAIISEVNTSLSELIKEREAEIQCDELPAIMGDKIQMEQLFQNLLSNSIKFTPAGKKPAIKIGVVSDEKNWKFSITDEGIGINPEYKDKLFRMFQRLHNKEEYPGTGIGLAICKRIVERHHGTIWFESQEGKGTTFFFTLPKIHGR